MSAFFVCLLSWLVALGIESSIVTMFPWFQPNLFFLFSTLFCLHWRGAETYFIALLFGITVDCFSTLPFGIFGFVFFAFSFFIRWYAIKIYQESPIIIVILIGIFDLALNVLVYFIISIIFDVNQFTFQWLLELVINEVFMTAILAIPSYTLFLMIENRFKIRLSERKF